MRLRIVGRNARAGGAECVIFGHVGRGSHRFAPVSPERRGDADEFSSHGDWEVRAMRPGSGMSIATALVGAEGGGVDCRTSGRLVLVSHSWSGKLEINDIGRKYAVDLYSPETRLVLVDAVHEIVVDVTPLAAAENGVLALPPLPPEAIVAHIVGGEAWFRFLDRDADFAPSLPRRAVEAFRARPGEALKLRLMSALLPRLTRRETAAPAPPAPPAVEAPMRVRDELRMLAAAVEGLALRSRA